MSGDCSRNSANPRADSDEAATKALLANHFNVSRETIASLARYAELLRDEAPRQNLVSATTLPVLWSRHILDSAQLLKLAKSPSGRWLDLGSGAGLPGIVVGMLSDARVTLVESRRLRIAFLERVVGEFDLAPRVDVAGMLVERLTTSTFDTITARAFVPLDRIFALATRFAANRTQWILPKGRGAQEELAATRRTWQGEFTVVPSITDPEAGIILARHIKPRRSV